jgi:cell wall-associated NlpC family hydrolase
LTTGRRQPRNRLFYRPNPRIACAAYTAYILRHCGRGGGSYSATAQYGQLRRWGGKLVATKMSTRYTPYFKYLKAGDFIFFHKAGGRIGHVEIYVGNGRVSGTSSSAGRVGIRRMGNRGFRLASVVRI